MLRAEALRETGLFDDGFFLYYEEVELMHRLHGAGWTIRHVPQSRVVHIEGASTGVGAATVEEPLPAYWYQSRRRYFALVRRPGRSAVRQPWLAHWLHACQVEAVFRQACRSRPDERHAPPRLLAEGRGCASLCSRAGGPAGQAARMDGEPVTEETMVAAVVIGRNEGERLAPSLRSVQAAGIPLVYVISGSIDGSPERARQMDIPVSRARPRRPFSAARGRNEGVQERMRRWPELPYVIFLDGDCELEPGFLDRRGRRIRAEPDSARSLPGTYRNARQSGRSTIVSVRSSGGRLQAGSRISRHWAGSWRCGSRPS